jgi:hypothetical protein
MGILTGDWQRLVTAGAQLVSALQSAGWTADVGDAPAQPGHPGGGNGSKGAATAAGQFSARHSRQSMIQLAGVLAAALADSKAEGELIELVPCMRGRGQGRGGGGGRLPRREGPGATAAAAAAAATAG